MNLQEIACSEAAKKERIDILKLMKDFGVDMSKQISAMYEACRYDRVHSVKFLLNNGFDIETPIERRTHTELMSILGNIDLGVGEIVLEPQNRSFHIACMNGAEKVVKLLDEGEDVNIEYEIDDTYTFANMTYYKMVTENIVPVEENLQVWKDLLTLD